MNMRQEGIEPPARRVNSMATTNFTTKLLFTRLEICSGSGNEGNHTH